MTKGTPSVGDDYRCGACHNTFDAKIRIELLNKYEITKNAQLFLSFSGLYFSYISMVVWRTLYTLPWVLAVVVLMSPSSNASCLVKEF